TQAADHSIATLHRVHSCLSACLLGAHALFLAGFERGTTFGALACKIVSGAAVYLFLAVFCWLLCEGFMYTKSLIVVLPGVDSTFAKVKFRHYCLLSILAPAAILVPVALIRSDQMIQYRANLEGYSASLEERAPAGCPTGTALIGPSSARSCLSVPSTSPSLWPFWSNCPGGISEPEAMTEAATETAAVQRDSSASE
uniref:GpcrRhopsn4 domain-containing protein n=1 Tax=Macrostomum lignano TaxID=282301 RepID=A0A1I8FLN5_9PLAT